MHHFEEHIIELYVLDSEKVKEQKTEIESHLDQCASCRELAEQMKKYYADVEKEIAAHKDLGNETEQEMVRSHVDLTGQQMRFRTPTVYRPVSRIQQLQYFVRRHPVSVGAGSFAFLAGMALLANVMFKSPRINDTNPAFARYNEASSSVEILNNRDQLLWQIPSRDISAVAKAEGASGLPNVVIDDIDGDGRDEVLTTLWHPVDGMIASGYLLRVYDYRNNLLFKKTFEEPIRYLNRQYSNSWSAQGVITDAAEVRAEKDIFVRWCSVRSPAVVVRLDARGNELGEYWHFGVPNCMSTVELKEGEPRSLVLAGTNDSLDSLHQEFPFIAVLNPMHIVGKKKSVGTPGFDLTGSGAEIYYLRLPISPLSVALARTEGVISMAQDVDGTLAFWVATRRNPTDLDYADYEYRFSKNLRILQVKSTDVTNRLYSTKVREGLLKGSIDAAYLNGLKNGVRYWDGKEWRKGPVKVNHDLLVKK